MMNKGRVAGFFSAFGLAAVATAVAFAGAASEGDAGAHAPQLPPDWTEADMQACMAAATPGEMHEQLMQSAGRWEGEMSMWMGPHASEPITSDCEVVITPIMDGRYVQVEWTGDIPGMGPFRGMGINGFDNVSQQLVSTWIDNYSTGIMQGVGELTGDGKTLTWNYTFNCPVTKQPATMREVETITGPNTKTLEMHMADPKSGEEYKMMHVDFTRADAVTQ